MKRMGVLLTGLAMLSMAAAAIGQSAEMLKAKQFFDTAGNPDGKWIEGETMMPHVFPAPHF